MKKSIRKTILMVFMIGVMSLMISGTALAAKKIALESTAWLNYTGWLEVDNLPKNAKLVSAKSSNNKILKVNGVTKGAVIVDLKKAGKVKVTVTYKVGSKKKKFTQTVEVKKYLDPVKKVSVNGRNIKINRRDPDTVSTELLDTKGKVTIKVTLKSGWSIVKNSSYIEIEHYALDKDGDVTEEAKMEKKRFKNGMTVSKKTEEDDIYVELILKNKKNQKMPFALYL